LVAPCFLADGKCKALCVVPYCDGFARILSFRTATSFFQIDIVWIDAVAKIKAPPEEPTAGL